MGGGGTTVTEPTIETPLVVAPTTAGSELSTRLDAVEVVSAPR